VAYYIKFAKSLGGLKMAFHIPAQDRSVDPYSSYNSDNVNGLTRIFSKGLDVVSSGLDVEIDTVTSIIVGAGVGIKDDVMINITEDNINIDLTDPEWFVETTAMNDSTAKYYVVMDYVYLKSSPAPRASIRILKNRGQFTERYMFLKCMEITNSEVTRLWNYDPDDPTIGRRGAAILINFVSELPPWTPDQEGLVYMLIDGSMLIIGSPTEWVYIPTQLAGYTYTTAQILVSLPPFVEGQDEGHIIIIGQQVFIGGDDGWVEVSAGGCAATLSGVSNVGGDIDFHTGTTSAEIYPNDISNTILIAASLKHQINFNTGDAVIINGLFTFDVNHALNTSDFLIVQVYERGANIQILPSLIEELDTNSFRLGFNTNPGDISVVYI
jgi:hypothetical protein